VASLNNRKDVIGGPNIKSMKTSLQTASSLLIAGAVFLAAAVLTPHAEAAPKSVLVVSTTKGFRHSSIPTAEQVLGELARKSGAFTVEYARVEPNEPQFKGPDGKPDKGKVDAAIQAVLAEKMSPEALKKYDAIVFANTTGELPLPDKEAFMEWIRSGKGFVGMHAATDTFHNYPPFVEMIGGTFKSHGAQVSVDILNQDKECPACTHLPGQWTVFDEIYLFKNYDQSKVHNLLSLDKHPNDKTPGHYPISWCKSYGKGRVFYTSLGHREDVWTPDTPANVERKNSKEVAEAFQKHILSGIKWALGLEKWNIKGLE
jgi:type 1 glutamine amidotransferase